MLAHPAPAPADDAPGGREALRVWRGAHGRIGRLAHAARPRAVGLQRPGSAVDVQSSLSVPLLRCPLPCLQTASPARLLPAWHVVSYVLALLRRPHVAAPPDSTMPAHGQAVPPSRLSCHAAARALLGGQALLGALLHHDSPVSSGNTAQSHSMAQ